MKLSEEKKEELRNLLEDIIEDIELVDVEIEPMGRNDYDIVDFRLSVDVHFIMQQILDIIED